jgi:hypothetical protein
MAKPYNTRGFHAFVSRGEHEGVRLYPHLHEDGTYVVSLTRFARDYVRIASEADLEAWLLKGYRLRMSNINEGIPAPSLIVPTKIYRAVAS